MHLSAYFLKKVPVFPGEAAKICINLHTKDKYYYMYSFITDSFETEEVLSGRCKLPLSQLECKSIQEKLYPNLGYLVNQGPRIKGCSIYGDNFMRGVYYRSEGNMMCSKYIPCICKKGELYLIFFKTNFGIQLPTTS